MSHIENTVDFYLNRLKMYVSVWNINLQCDWSSLKSVKTSKDVKYSNLNLLKTSKVKVLILKSDPRVSLNHFGFSINIKASFQY